jgi:small subunit ribosomal protein S20
MANHKSAIKRIRNGATKRLRNRYQMKSTRTVLKTVRNSKTKIEASPLFLKASSMLDKLAKRGIIHRNNAANKKSKLAKLIAKLA